MATNLRIGQGYDLHQTDPAKPLILGGVRIPSDFGLKGHSDADVLLHAVTDALFGAASLGDIGRHFPDTDPKYRGADSGELLKTAVRLVREKGYGLVNVDCTVIAQKPKLAPHMNEINANLARLLGLPADRVNVKAKTNEKLGYLGRSEGIEAQAVALLEKLD
ncbi:MAG: 2-C-methyl-D-erythritol 2,4-cyclodiphosphate synthase [Klebsiella quasipneumoniae]|nr:2-C-methyl-D-erythritol 2,4-cyclodiphosphate synthase [Klebsiella quasipneumoniae]